MDQKRKYVDRKFGHSVVIWEITNFCFFVHDVRESLAFNSPEFYVRSFPPTKWRLTMKIAAEDEKRKNIRPVSFELKRLEHNDNFQEVSADCKACIYDRLGVEYSIDFKRNFLPNSKYDTKKIDFLNKNFLEAPLENYMDSFVTEVFQIQLKILVQSQGSVESSSPCSDLGIKRLSEDLCHLYESKENHDIVLTVGDTFIRAHRPILCSRIKHKGMADCLSIHPRYPLSVQNTDYRAWDSVIRFLYSGNMKYAVTMPSICIYEIALSLVIEPITIYYQPEILNLYSAADVEEYNLKWTINNFFVRTQAILSSPSMTGINCRLKIYPRGLGNKSEWTGLYIDIEAEEKDICAEIFLETAIEWTCLYQSHKRIMGREVFGNKKAVARATLQNYHWNGSLTFGLRLRITAGTYSNVVEESIILCEPFSEQLTYSRFSEDLLSLYKDQKYTDVAPAVSSGLRTKFHKCILSTRCMNDLHETILKGFPDNKEMVESGAFEHLLFFLYSGRLNESLSPQIASILYTVAEKFYMGALKDATIHYLNGILNAQNAKDIYEFAASKDIFKLTNRALTFLPDRRA